MIEAKLGDIQNSIDALKNLYSAILPTKIAYRIKKIIKFCHQELVDFDEVKNKKIQDYGETKISEEGKEFLQVKEENIAQYTKEILELLEEKIDFDKLAPLLIEEIANATLSAADLDKISWLIKE